MTALRAEPELAGLCAEAGCIVVLMHMLGDPRTMQDDPRYEDVVDDVRAFLAERIEAAVAAGIAEERIWVDPGIGFGKTVEHNLELTRRLGELAELGRPIVYGSSRKSFIGKLTGAEADERLGGTIASNVLAAANGAEVLRVHDVAAMRDALTTAEAIYSAPAVEDLHRVGVAGDQLRVDGDGLDVELRVVVGVEGAGVVAGRAAVAEQAGRRADRVVGVADVAPRRRSSRCRG